MTTGADVAASIKRTLRILSAATVFMYLALAGLGIFVWHDAGQKRAELASVALSTNNALCSLRDDLTTRIQVSENFLKENPDGVPGISVATIKQSISNTRRTLKALSGLNCI